MRKLFLSGVAVLALGVGAAWGQMIGQGPGSVPPSQFPNVQTQFNADQTGVTNTASAFTAADTAAQNTRAPLFVPAPSSSYLLNSSPSIASPMFLLNPNFSGTGFPIPIVDGSAAQGTSGFAFAQTLSQTANQNTAFVSAYVPITSGTVSYQKNALYAKAVTADPSDYGNSYMRDTVGIAGFGQINTTSLGRAWGANFVCTVSTGADGTCQGLEIDVKNNGTTQTGYATQTQKTGLNIVAMGSANTTAALTVSSSGASFYDGLTVNSTAITHYAWDLWNGSSYLAWVDTSGNANFPALVSTGTTMNWSNTHGVQFGIIDGGASTVNNLVAQGSVTAGVPAIKATGSDSNIAVQMKSKGTGTVFLSTGNGNQFEVLDSGASGVNFVTVKGGATTVAPVVAATGSDSNVTMQLSPKGTGTIQVTANGVTLPNYTVATLPTCSTTNKYTVAAVSDATSPTYGGTLTGSGAVVIMALCNGSAWVAH